MTLTEFEKGYCERSHITQEEYREHFVTLPCKCDDPDCPGWACVTNNPAMIQAHHDLYTPTELQ